MSIKITHRITSGASRALNRSQEEVWCMASSTYVFKVCLRILRLALQ